jgi:hypothetical protein
MVERFYTPLAGRLTLDGKNVEDLELDSYRSWAALVSQEPTLYDGTLLQNVLYGHPDPDTVTLEQVYKTCRDAKCVITDIPESHSLRCLASTTSSCRYRMATRRKSVARFGPNICHVPRTRLIQSTGRTTLRRSASTCRYRPRAHPVRTGMPCSPALGSSWA